MQYVNPKWQDIPSLEPTLKTHHSDATGSTEKRKNKTENVSKEIESIAHSDEKIKKKIIEIGKAKPN